MSLADEKVWSQAVFLAGGAAFSDPLQFMYDSGDCEHHLKGQIAELDVEGLQNTLDELVAEAVADVGCAASTGLLPGESDGCFAQEDMEPCSDNDSIPGNGTEESPCVYDFTLESDDESFRLSADMTYLNRRILSPEGINVDLLSPSGTRRTLLGPAVTAQISGSSAYRAVKPFWFLLRQLYDSRWEMIGHQAAVGLAGRDSASRDHEWEWEGEWQLLFWGENPEAAADAAKAAAAVRYTRRPAPVTEPAINENHRLVGYVDGWPEDDGYQSVAVRLRVEHPGGEPLYSTRRHLECGQTEQQCDPLSIVEDGKQYRVDGVYEELLWWDSLEAAGNNTLRELVDEGTSTVGVVAIEQEFVYGGENGPAGEPLTWSRDIGSVVFNSAEMRSILDDREEWERLLETTSDGLENPLPHSLQFRRPARRVRGRQNRVESVGGSGVFRRRDRTRRPCRRLACRSGERAFDHAKLGVSHRRDQRGNRAG